MGIPLLFSYLSRRYKNTGLLKKYNNTEECDNLYLDYNGLIHKVINELKENTEEYYLMEEIYKETVKIFELVKPKKLLYIAIDGVAPRAKMNQQRMRRFKSARVAKGVEMVFFDRNKVTPGTEFMDELSKFLKEKFDRWKKGVKIIFSDVNEKGEGEHKIMEYIRTNYASIKEDNHIIQGLDCDLVMLSMTVDIKMKLLREDNKNKRNPNRQDCFKQSDYIIFDIKQLRKFIIEDIIERTGIKGLNGQRVLNDFILITCLIGNDFITNLPTLKVKTNGINILLNVYSRLYKYRVLNSNRYLINEDKEIDLKLFGKFMKYLGDSESYYFSNFSLKDKEFFNEKDYKTKYYVRYFKTEEEEYIKKVSERYMETLQWIVEYYFKGVKDWRLFYPYYYSPFSGDFVGEYGKRESIEREEYKPIEQLVSVLPVKSLPKYYRNKLEVDGENIKYMFPDKFEVDNRDENIPEHARNALIPFVDDKLLFSVLFA
jgi:5'-3' exonuclease